MSKPTDWQTVDMEIDLGKRSYVPIEVSATCPTCGEEETIDEIPLLYAIQGDNEFEIVCWNEDCGNYNEIIGTANIELRVTVEAKVSYE
jgi:hypothetical protein